MPEPNGQIDTKEELLDALQVRSLDDLEASEEARQRMIEVAKNLTPGNLRELLVTIPELKQGLVETIKSVESVGKSLEETKRHRWTIIQDLAKSGSLTGDQALEAMQILKEIEREEKIDWGKIVQSVVAGLGAIALFAVAIASTFGDSRRA